ncbi:MAG: acyl-CoA dehydrogenase family protein, partial [Thermoanaerobaculia bacterium]
ARAPHHRANRNSQTRIQAGAPLLGTHRYTHKLIAPNAESLEAARAYIEWAAERIDAGEPDLATEGAIAKYAATEAGNKACEDAIQALGGYGYTREYLVEKYKRDVRITTIYEGTSEIMEWTIARDRWQLHLKTKGAWFRDWAARLLGESGGSPASGAPFAAAALSGLAALYERCRIDRLTRSQHVLFRLGELTSWAETAAIFSERAVAKPTTAIALPAQLLQSMARVHAREAFYRVACEGLRWANGAGQGDPDLASALNVAGALKAQAGLLADLDVIARGLVEAFPAA